jgi:hypothetical protein
MNLVTKFTVLWEDSKLRSEVVFFRILRATVLADLLRTDLGVINSILIGFFCCYKIGIIPFTDLGNMILRDSAPNFLSPLFVSISSTFIVFNFHGKRSSTL